MKDTAQPKAEPTQHLQRPDRWCAVVMFRCIDDYLGFCSVQPVRFRSKLLAESRHA